MSGSVSEIISGEYMYELAKDLWPICRSITGPGVRKSLEKINDQLNGRITIQSVPSGTVAFDWTVPHEWSIRDAWVENELGQRIIDFRASNLHVVGYSEPVDCWLDLERLQDHLYSLPDQPDAVPYVTSYYKRRWGFCLSHNQRNALPNGRYRAVIDAELKPGVLNYGELVIKGDSESEVFLSTYICHPSMANNELSGPIVTTGIVKWLLSLPTRRYTYRIVFIPETIGSLVYLSQKLQHLKKHVIAGFNVTCIGDDRCYSYLPSRSGKTLADRAAKHALNFIDPSYKSYSWLDRGSDERQYCAPGVDLPMATIMRSKYGEYPEYHTSLDDLNFVTPSGLEGGFRALRLAIEAIELNCKPQSTVIGEPQLGKRGLYSGSGISQKGYASGRTKAMKNLLSFADGSKDLIEIADLIGISIFELVEISQQLQDHNLIRVER